MKTKTDESHPEPVQVKKEYAKTPCTLSEWDHEKVERTASKKTSISLVIRSLTESLDEVVLSDWKLWRELIVTYNLDPHKDYYTRDGTVFERKKPWE
jgi:hypothetical protein